MTYRFAPSLARRPVSAWWATDRSKQPMLFAPFGLGAERGGSTCFVCPLGLTSCWSHSSQRRGNRLTGARHRLYTELHKFLRISSSSPPCFLPLNFTPRRRDAFLLVSRSASFAFTSTTPSPADSVLFYTIKYTSEPSQQVAERDAGRRCLVGRRRRPRSELKVTSC